MTLSANQLETIVLSNGFTTALIILIIAVCAYRAKSLLQEIAETAVRFWHGFGLVWLGSIVVTIGWITFRDDWFKLLIEPYRSMQIWESQRKISDPVSGDTRTVTYVLVGLLVVLSAALFAKYIGGIGLQLVILLGSIVLWMPAFIFSQRFSILVVDGASTSNSWLDVGGVLAIWTVRESLTLTLVALSLSVLTMLVAPIVTVLLEVLHLRHDPITDEADAFFTSVHDYAGEREVDSLHDRWRPIERPV